MKPSEYVYYRPGLTEAECRLLDRIVREMAELRSVSMWCYYHANEWKREQLMKGKAA